MNNFRTNDRVSNFIYWSCRIIDSGSLVKLSMVIKTVKVVYKRNLCSDNIFPHTILDDVFIVSQQQTFFKELLNTIFYIPVHDMTFQKVGLLQMKMVRASKKDDGDGDVWYECNNLTLINLVLIYTGPMREDKLCLLLLALQVLCSCVAFTIRYPLAHFFYSTS